jgi:hypothetical protein
MKKFIALLLSFCMAFTLAAPAFAAADDPYSSSIDYSGSVSTLAGSTVATVTVSATGSLFYTVQKDQVEIAYRLLGVTKDQVTKVTIKGNISGIEAETFADFTALKTVTLPNTLTSIGARAFENCSSLTTLTLPASVTSIGADAFAGCTSLETVTVNVPANVTFDAAAQAAMQKALGDTVTLNTVAVPAVTYPSDDAEDDTGTASDPSDASSDGTALLIVGGAVAAAGVATAVYLYTHPEIYQNAVQAVQDAYNSAVNSITSALGLNQSAAAPAEAEAAPAESVALAA